MLLTRWRGLAVGPVAAKTSTQTLIQKGNNHLYTSHFTPSFVYPLGIGKYSTYP